MDDASRPETEPEPSGAGGAPPVAPPAPPQTGAPAPGEGRKGLTAAIVVIAIVAIAALGIAGWMYYQTTATQRAAVEQLEEATAFVESADVVVLELDEIVRAEISSEMTTQVAGVAERVPGAIDELEQAIVLIDDSIEDLPDDEIAYARALKDSASARLDMLAQADPILEANAKAAAALGPANEGWALVLEANELSRQSVVEYNKLTQDSVKKSAELTRQSNVAITEARSLFSEAATAFPEAELQPYIVHCEAKLAALLISKQADEAFLGGRPAEANTLSDKFNAAERELAAKAAELPPSPAIPIAAAYESLARESTELYFQARTQATEADARLREADGDADTG